MFAGRKKPRGVNVHRGQARVDKAELRQKKYRYLYQVRTAHGDVISQVILNSIVGLLLNWKCKLLAITFCSLTEREQFA